MPTLAHTLCSLFPTRSLLFLNGRNSDVLGDSIVTAQRPHHEVPTFFFGLPTRSTPGVAWENGDADGRHHNP